MGHTGQSLEARFNQHFGKKKKPKNDNDKKQKGKHGNSKFRDGLRGEKAKNRIFPPKMG